MSDDLDTVRLTVGNKIIEGWDSVRVTRSIERFPSDFSLGLMDYYPGTNDKQLVQEGQSCEVRIGNDLVLTGYVDSWEPSITRPDMKCRRTGAASVRIWWTALQSGQTMSSTKVMR
jgi:prophage tail gpP-like protein